MRSRFNISVLAFLLTSAVQAQPLIGGGSCTNSTLNGVYYYLLTGDLLSGNLVYPYAELGKLVADGQGNVSGSSHASIGGSISAYTLSGTYSVQSSCTGSMSLSVNSQAASSLAFQIANGGLEALVSFSSSSGVIAGRAYRQTASSGTIQCSTASLSGSYAYLLTGVVIQGTTGFFYSQDGSATGDGKGNLSATGMANVNGNTLSSTGQGPYSVSSDCSGTATVRNQNGTANYFTAVAEDGLALLFMESDAGYVVAGVGEPLFVTAQSAVVNAASFNSSALAPGGIFSVFGTGLAQSAASTRVTVNGEIAPISFANGSQINAQMPYDVPTDRPVAISVMNGGTASNTALLNVRQAGPGIFTYSGNRAVVQNQDYSINSPGNPARTGDTVIVYMTGPGAVNPPIPTGAVAPLSPLSTVTAPYSFTIGAAQAQVSYFGLTPGFTGLYQANVIVPSLPPGDYPVVSTIAGAVSNGPLISIH